MVGFGEKLPEIDDLATTFPDEVAELRDLSELPQDLEERLLTLRARTAGSPRMMVELAAVHSDRADFEHAG